MGTSDVLSSLKNKVVDAATYDLLRRNFDLLEENNGQLKEQATFLKEQVATQRDRIHQLEAEVTKLKAELDRTKKDGEFRIYKGMAFKKKADGKFSEQPYCPNCHRVMSVVEGFIVTCTPCNHTLTLENERLPGIAKWLDENPE
ncbi:MAG: hypothetical protein SWQ30_06180 [Thermodesulfobacteriota bacterium]|nr:hypothetical protein [Thermodesulfobacteriota bacterium]